MRSCPLLLDTPRVIETMRGAEALIVAITYVVRGGVVLAVLYSSYDAQDSHPT